MIKSLEDIKISYDEERYKNEVIFAIRKKDLYDEYRGLKKIDNKLIDIYTDMSISAEERKKKIDELKKEKEKFIEENNIDKNYDKMIYTCEKCHDTGFIDGKKCECFKEKELKMFKNIFENNKSSKACSFDKIDYKLYDQDIKGPNGTSYIDYMKLVVNLMKKQVLDMDEKPCNALIYGPTGVGKTYLAHCIGEYAYNNKKSVMYLKMSEYIDYIYAKDIKKYLYNLEEFASIVDLLIVDDFGKEYNTDFTLSKIYNLIDERIEKNKSTVIVTHFERKDLLDIYGESIISRIYNNYVVYRMYGIDLRSVKR